MLFLIYINRRSILLSSDSYLDKAYNKNIESPSCIDLLIFSSMRSFQNRKSTGLSDFLNIVITVLKTPSKKNPKKEESLR